MSLCIINGEQCVCQPDEGVACRYADPSDVQMSAFARIEFLEGLLGEALDTCHLGDDAGLHKRMRAALGLK